MKIEQDNPTVFTLTLLGTDTLYDPNPSDTATRGESLSVVSKLIQNPTEPSNQPVASDDDSSILASNEEDQPKSETSEKYKSNPVKLNHQAAAVVDGPTTLGTEVGDRIAHAVRLALEAIARGQTKINIAAHSRGAVEALLVSHELQRIQDLCKKDSGLSIDELTNSDEKQYTQTAMINDKHKKAYNDLDLKKIKKNMANVKLAIFNIDPVPGGDLLLVTRATSFAWKDPRMFIVPEIVEEYVQILYKNEHTRCFKPVVPEALSKNTKCSIYTFSGHHGTGSGNLSDQTHEMLPQTKAGAVDVQDALIVQMVDFLTRNGTKIDQEQAIKHPTFSDLFHQCQQAGLFEQDRRDYKKETTALKLSIFDKLLKAEEYCKVFDDTSYGGSNKSWVGWLAQEESFLGIVRTRPRQRIIHYKGYNDTYLSTIFPRILDGKFYSEEHATLYLNDRLNLNDENELDKTIDNIFNKINAIFTQSSSSSSLASSDNNDVFANLLLNNQPDACNMVISAIDTVCNQVQQYYFTSSEKNSRLYVSIEKAFKIVDNLPNKDTAGSFANNLYTKLNKRLNCSIKEYHSNLIDQSKYYNNKVHLTNSYKNQLEVLKQELQSQLTKKSDDSKNVNKPDESEISGLIKTIQEFINDLDEDNINKEYIDIKLQDQKRALNSYITFCNQENIELLSMGSKIDELLQTAIDINQRNNIENLMPELVNNINSIDTFINGIKQFKKLDPLIDVNTLSQELHTQKAILINLGAQYLLDNDLKHQYSADGIANEGAYQQMEALSTSGEKRRNPLKQKLDEANEIIREQTSLIENKELEKDQTDRKLKQLSAKGTRTEKLAETQLETIKIKDIKIGKITQENTQLGETLEKAKKENQTLQGQNETLTQKNTQLEETLENANSGNQILQTQNEALTQENTQLKDELETLQSIMNDPYEQKCQGIINDKLKPLTSEYLKHLQDEISKLKGINSSKLEALEKKVEIINNLYEKLIDAKELRASKRIEQFDQLMKVSNTTFTAHRDPAWLRFIANAAKAIAVVFTGGLGLTLAASPKFWQSKGQTFFNKCDEEVKNNVPPSVNSISKP